MSGSSPLFPPHIPYDEDPSVPSTPLPPSLTRTVAIIKTHALNHRFDIEPRILEASFEIVKERPMEFDTETDPETLYELFGEDADSLAEGPVWVYVLERRRAVEVWNTLMGDRNPEVARKLAPNSLRSLYGISLKQNGLMGSPDAQTAEMQISSLFASSPPFPTTDLPEDGQYGSVRSVSSSVLSALRKTGPDEGYAPSNSTNPSNAGGSNGRVTANSGKILFRARPLPSTHLTPDIAPRTTRAASLRAGIAIEKTPIIPRAPATKESLAKAFANVPGHKRNEIITVASVKAPTIAPRMTRAASLRLGQPAPVRPRPSTADNSSRNTFEGVPGHKRRETISVESIKAPIVVPRLNKSAALRVSKEAAPPSSYMFRTPSAPKTPGLSRSNSTGSFGAGKISRPPSQASIQSPPSRPLLSQTPSAVSRTTATLSRASSAVSRTATSISRATSALVEPFKNATSKPPINKSNDAVEPTAKPKPRPSSVAAAAPTVIPRTNRSAVLRAAKLERDAAANAKGVRPKPAPPRALIA